MVMLCLAQLGPFLPMLGGVIWLFLGLVVMGWLIR